MDYIGLQELIRVNRRKSYLMLACFPLIALMITFMMSLFVELFHYGDYIRPNAPAWSVAFALPRFYRWTPWVLGFCALWLVGAYFWHTKVVDSLMNLRPVPPKYRKRLETIVEKVSASAGISTPRIMIIDNDYYRNAFASGIDEKTYTVTFTTGLLNILDDKELEGVVAHEISHIVNEDTKLMVVAFVFAGIFQTILTIIGGLSYVALSDGGVPGVIFGILGLLLWLVFSAGYISTVLTRLCLSRKREYLADSGAVELTANPSALASALRKIQYNNRYYRASIPSGLQPAMFYWRDDRSSWWKRLWSTHPDVETRIRILENMDCTLPKS